MASDLVRLKLDGEVSLRDFQTAMSALLGLLEGLTEEATEDEDKVDWVVTDLESGSATIVCAGVALDEDAIPARDYVVTAYSGLAVDMARGNLTEYSESIQKSARQLASIVNGRIPRILMSSGEDEAQEVASPIAITQHADFHEIPSYPIKNFMRTTLKGEVVMASKDMRHYFTLRQSYTGKKIRCYVGQKASLWDTAYKCLGMHSQIVLVEGLHNVKGDVLSQIKAIELLPKSTPDGWREAIGAAIPPKDSISTHDAIRKVRDGE